MPEKPRTHAPNRNVNTWKPVPRHDWRAWLPTISLSCAAFIFVSSEIMPVGLLPDIAAGMNMSEAATGLLVTAYAWMVALMSLPLTVLSARWERRRLMLLLLGVFVAGNLAAGLSRNFWMLLTARICIAMAHSVFWAITTPLAARLAPEGKRARALSFIILGSSMAIVLGVPLGTALGHALGWRLAFIAVAVVAMLVLAIIGKLLPHLPSSDAGSLNSLPLLLRRPHLLAAYALTALTVTGHFTAYTYITPFLQQVGHMTAPTSVLLLLIIGGAGIPGSWLGGKLLDSTALKAQSVSLAVLCVCLALMAPVAAHLYGTMALCAVWGMSMTVLALLFQSRVLQLAPEAADVATAIYSGIYNVGIGGGALLGSVVITRLSLVHIGGAGALAVLSALLLSLYILYRKRTAA